MRIVLLLMFLFVSSTCFCQYTYEYCDFESPCNVIRIDTSSPENIWQIGIAKKPNFFFITNTISTDTLLPYPPNNYSAFYVKIPRAEWETVEKVTGAKVTEDGLQDAVMTHNTFQVIIYHIINYDINVLEQKTS